MKYLIIKSVCQESEGAGSGRSRRTSSNRLGNVPNSFLPFRI